MFLPSHEDDWVFDLCLPAERAVDAVEAFDLSVAIEEKLALMALLVLQLRLVLPLNLPTVALLLLPECLTQVK